MKLKLLIITLLTICLNGAVMAQQDKIITNYMYDQMSINPGETGINDGICATTIYRNQWDKVSRAPNSTVLNLEANMTRFFPGGIGIALYADRIGFQSQNSVLLNYSYPLELSGYGVLGIGVGVGIMNYGVNPNWEPPQQGTIGIDMTLPPEWSATGLDLNFGLFFKGDADYYVGLSATHLSETAVQSATTAVTSSDWDSKRHYYIMGGKTFRGVGPGDIQADAKVMTDFAKTAIDLTGRYMWNNIAYGGIGIRNVEYASILLGYRPLPDLTVGYSYDITMNKLAGVSRGSHEILLKYCFYLPPPPIEKSKHPRWL
jgi:type IX secretion system PorP/SprF family membrane protein